MASEKKATHAVGIDLGTTYSCVAVVLGKQTEIIANELGNRTTPSCVAFTDSERLYGQGAMNQAARNPSNTIFDAKRLIGRNFDDPVVQADMKLWPFTVVSNPKNKPLIQVNWKGKKKQFPAEQISSFILGKMKATAEKRLGEPVESAVITVPAYFNDAQRAATKDAGTMSGLRVLRIINEPTAAALAYGLNDKKKTGGSDDEINILIFDLGGGTFDVSILTLEDGVFEVQSTAGDTHLGGEDFDNKLVEWCVKDFKKKNREFANINFNKQPRAMRRLRTACEKAKRVLSDKPKANIEVDNFHDGQDLNLTVTRSRFENLCQKYFNGCLEPVQLVLDDAKMSKDDINEVILVGGSSRIPKVRELIKKFFGGKELNESINPDEAVALGAAVQAYILNDGKTEGTELDGIILLDVAPLSLGLETAGGVMTQVIERNTTIPCSRSQIFSTSEDNQHSVEIRIFEGEREFAVDNNLLGKFTLGDIPDAPRGIPQIQVNFNVDASGILNIYAEEKSSGSKSKITITNDNDNRLTTDQIEKMILDSSMFAEEDKGRKEKIQSRNKLENYIHRLKNTVPKEKSFSDDDKTLIMNMVDEKMQWLELNKTTGSADDFKKQLASVATFLKPIILRTKKNAKKVQNKS